METHRNGFVPYYSQPHYIHCHPRIPPPHPSEIVVPRELVPINRSPIRCMAGGMSSQSPNSHVSQGPQQVCTIAPSMYNPPSRLAVPIVPHMVPQAYYAYPTRPAHYSNSRYEKTVNGNANLPPNNFLNNHQPPQETAPPVQSRWIKPTIFYDGFWTEQKVKKWISDQFIEESSLASSSVDNKTRHINRAH